MRSPNQQWLADLIASPRPCGEADWPGVLNRDGYGKVRWEGRHRRPHTVVLESAAGPAPIDKPMALHSCDRPQCCALTCLRWGSARDNATDARDRDRHCAGERHGRARLNVEQVRAIRTLWAEGTLTQTQIGDMFGVSNVTVSAIVIRRLWPAA